MDLNFDIDARRDPPARSGTPGWAQWCGTWKTCPKHTVYCGCDEETSQTALLDGWSLVHVIVGMTSSIPLFYLDSVAWALVINITVAITWEVLENAACVVQCTRTSGTSKTYEGDSIWNSLADVLCNMFGFVCVFLIYQSVHGT